MSKKNLVKKKVDTLKPKVESIMNGMSKQERKHIEAAMKKRDDRAKHSDTIQKSFDVFCKSNGIKATIVFDCAKLAYNGRMFTSNTSNLESQGLINLANMHNKAK